MTGKMWDLVGAKHTTWDIASPVGRLDGGDAGGRVGAIQEADRLAEDYLHKLEAIADAARAFYEGDAKGYSRLVLALANLDGLKSQTGSE